jgi:hypothetical protein
MSSFARSLLLGVAVTAFACADESPPTTDDTDTLPVGPVDRDGDGDPETSDCDDLDDTRASTFAEVYYDGIDNDCDAATVDDDQDGDGDPVSTDCDDVDGARSSLLVEAYYDGIDNDCDAPCGNVA